jgi:dTDP-4-dehydrorhamnose 3,5-epimerase
MNRFTVHETPLPGLKVVERQLRSDSRGFLARIFCADELSPAGWGKPIAQINHTYTAKSGTVRGMHYQNPPHSEKKLVTCLRGLVWDVAVDLRAGSNTFLQWHAVELSPDNRRALLIPEGFAHGFQTLTDDCELIYLHTENHSPESEGAFNAQDPRLAIRWPHPITELSPRDQGHPVLTGDFEGVVL